VAKSIPAARVKRARSAEVSGLGEWETVAARPPDRSRRSRQPTDHCGDDSPGPGESRRIVRALGACRPATAVRRWLACLAPAGRALSDKFSERFDSTDW